MNDQYDNEKTDKEMLEKHATGERPVAVAMDEVEQLKRTEAIESPEENKKEPGLDPITKEYMVNIISKLPSITEDELRGARFPEEVIDVWKRVWSRPPIGKVHVATAREYRSNCKMLFFVTPEDLNDWFDANPGHILFDWKTSAGGVLYCIIGQVLSPEEQDDMELRASVINEEVEKRKQERAAQLEAHAEKLKAEIAENKRLIEVGKKCEHNHGALIKEKRKNKKGEK